MRTQSPYPLADVHQITGQPLAPPYPPGTEMAFFAMGCFWGAEKCFWQNAGVHLTQVGYTAGQTAYPTYEEVCSGQTGHSEVVQVVFWPQTLTYEQLLEIFWTRHNPTQGMRQGNDIGSQYRSGIYTTGPEQQQQAEASRDHYQQCLNQAGLGPITTEIQPATAFYPAEAYHQQYLAKNPNGYCGLGGTGVGW